MSTPLTSGFRCYLKITFILYQSYSDSAVKAEGLSTEEVLMALRIHFYRAEAMKVGVLGGRTTHNLYKKLFYPERIYVHKDC